MDTEEKRSYKLTDIREKPDMIGSKLTPFSIVDILTKNSNGEENQAIDMSSKCITCDAKGKLHLFHD